MRHTSFARPCNAAAKCAVGSACSAANTDNNSILLLTIDTVLAVSIFAILSILGIAPPAERTKPVFAAYARLGIPGVGPDRFGRGRFFVV